MNSYWIGFLVRFFRFLLGKKRERAETEKKKRKRKPFFSKCGERRLTFLSHTHKHSLSLSLYFLADPGIEKKRKKNKKKHARRPSEAAPSPPW